MLYKGKSDIEVPVEEYADLILLLYLFKITNIEIFKTFSRIE